MKRTYRKVLRPPFQGTISVDAARRAFAKLPKPTTKPARDVLTDTKKIRIIAG